MKLRPLHLLLATAGFGGFAAVAASVAPAPDARVRIFILTDIENEPDDAQSMVRFLTYANQFDIEGLVATTSIHQRNKTAAWRIREIVEAYGKVQANLNLHEPGYPPAAQLLALIRDGRPAYGMDAVGEGHDSPGSELLIAAADRADQIGRASCRERV